MQIDIQVPEAYVNELVRQFKQSISERISPQDMEIEVIRPPGWAMGAEDIHTVRFKTSTLSTAAQIAGILSLCVALYGVFLRPDGKTCQIILTTGQAKTEATFPCHDNPPPGLIELLGQHVNKHGLPEKVQVTHEQEVKK